MHLTDEKGRGENGEVIMNEQVKAYDEKMKKTCDHLNADLVTIRAGRANPHILDKLVVDYYGSPTPIQQVGNISVPEARMIQIAPWEKSMIKAIEKAILASDIGITPSNDGTVIRLVFPELTEERRKELVKDVKKKGEDAKVAIRNIRRDGNEAFKKLSKNGDISEDEIKEMEAEVQAMGEEINTFIKTIPYVELRTIFRLRYVRFLSWEDIAEVFRWRFSESTLRRRTERYMAKVESGDAPD
jgi:ribosome recycling factor